MQRLKALFSTHSAFRNAIVGATAIVFIVLAVGPKFFASTPPSQRETASTQQGVTGQWLADFQEREDGLVQFTLRSEERKGDSFSSWNNSQGIAAAQLQGLTREQAMSSTGTEVRFQIKRDAGSFDCEGWFRGGRGAGHYTFSANRAFVPELNRRGISGTLTDSQLLTLTRTDVGFAVLDELKAQRYALPSMDQLVRMSERGVRLDFLKGLKTFGAKVESIEMLLKLRDNGVSIGYLEQLKSYGFRNLSADDLVRARAQGVSASFLQALNTEGYKNLTIDELVRLRSRGVSASFIQVLRSEGYPRLSLEELTKLRDSGVSASFIQELKQLGYGKLSIEQLTRLRTHGVTSSFIRRVKAAGVDNPTVDQLIELRTSGTQKFK